MDIVDRIISEAKVYYAANDTLPLRVYLGEEEYCDLLCSKKAQQYVNIEPADNGPHPTRVMFGTQEVFLVDAYKHFFMA